MCSADDPKWYWREFDSEFGPVPLASLEKIVATGQLLPTDEVRLGRTGKWLRVCDVTELQTLTAVTRRKRTERTSGAAGVQSIEEWYYRIDDGREHGPISLVNLLDVVSSSGETASDVWIRQGAYGEWMPFDTVGDVPMRHDLMRDREHITNGSHLSSGAPDQPLEKLGIRVADKVPLRANSRSICEKVRGSCNLVIGASVWLLLNVVVVFWPEAYATEHHYAVILRRLEAEVKEMQSRNAAPAEWVEMRERSRTILRPIIADLQESPNPSAPIRRCLLSAARDSFPHLIGPKSKEMEARQHTYDNYMRFAENQLSKH